jgi:type VI protein secretion system component VasF
MLKPADPPPAPDERSIGDLIEQVFDDAIDYGRAELDLIKAGANQLPRSDARAATPCGTAALLAIAGLVTLFVGIAIALARWIGPLGGAIVSALLAAGIAGLLVWLALRDLEDQR